MSESELKQKSNHINKSGTSSRTRWIAKTGILSAIAIILMYLEFNIPLMPVFLKFDFAEVAALLGAFLWGRGPE